jgi:hydroxymethylbilane synthase
VRIGTRASKLALTQSGMMQRQIAALLGADPSDADEVEAVAPLVRITTSGDRIQDRRLLDEGGKGLFVKEIEEALLDGRIDCAVHSLKDVPSASPRGLVLAAYPEREDPRDAFLSIGHASFASLPRRARLGTASLRRQTQSLFARPDLEVVLLRGNVDTRLAQLEAGEADAILLALSGLKRLGLGHLPKEILDPIERPPAPGQGALAIQSREADAGADWLQALNHSDTALAIAAERGALEALEGSCRTAIGAYAQVIGDQVELIVEALTPDGRERFRRQGRVGTGRDVRGLGLELGRAIMAEGGERLFLA